MGPDGEDALFTFLQGKLKGWQTASDGYKPLADTGNYPGEDEITEGLALIRPLLADEDSSKFIERFNDTEERPAGSGRPVPRPGALLRSPEADMGEAPQGVRAFQLNRLELEQDAQAGPALQTNAGNPVGPQSLRTHQGSRRPHQHRRDGELVPAYRAAHARPSPRSTAHIADAQQGRGRSPGRSQLCGRRASSRSKLCESRCRRKKASPTSPRPRARP